MKYIDADAIKNDILTLWDWDTVDGIRTSTVMKQILSDIDNINEAIVRCKDCKHNVINHGRYCTFGDCSGCLVADDFFCKNGERKETDG